MMNCDPVTGACLLPETRSATQGPNPSPTTGLAVRYVGDPMCSWCWGISPAVQALAAFCSERGLVFTLTMGGLRAGGGDPWSPAFKEFLRGEWRRIQQATGQPFGFGLLELDHFDYDTEPACRAVVTASLLALAHGLPSSAPLAFFSATQRRFYVQGHDPKTADFYRGICDQVAIPFDEFRQVFGSQRAREAVARDFAQCRQWGVRSFPSLLLDRLGEVSLLSAGHVTTETLINRVQSRLGAHR